MFVVDINSSKKRKIPKAVCVRSCKSRSRSNKNLSVSRSTPADTRRRISSLLKNNKSLAMALQDTRCELSSKKKLLKESNEYINKMKLARFKMLEMYSVLKTFMKNFDETLLLLKIEDSEWSGFGATNHKKLKSKLDQIGESIHEDHEEVPINPDQVMSGSPKCTSNPTFPSVSYITKNSDQPNASDSHSVLREEAVEKVVEKENLSEEESHQSVPEFLSEDFIKVNRNQTFPSVCYITKNFDQPNASDSHSVLREETLEKVVEKENLLEEESHQSVPEFLGEDFIKVNSCAQTLSADQESDLLHSSQLKSDVCLGVLKATTAKETSSKCMSLKNSGKSEASENNSPFETNIELTSPEYQPRLLLENCSPLIKNSSKISKNSHNVLPLQKVQTSKIPKFQEISAKVRGQPLSDFSNEKLTVKRKLAKSENVDKRKLSKSENEDKIKLSKSENEDSESNFCRRKTFVIKDNPVLVYPESASVDENSTNVEICKEIVPDTEEEPEASCRRKTFVVKTSYVPPKKLIYKNNRRKTFVKKCSNGSVSQEDKRKTFAIIKKNVDNSEKHTCTHEPINKTINNEVVNLHNIGVDSCALIKEKIGTLETIVELPSTQTSSNVKSPLKTQKQVLQEVGESLTYGKLDPNNKTESNSENPKSGINELKAVLQETSESLTCQKLNLNNEAESNSKHLKAKINCDFETEQNVVETAKESSKEVGAEILCCDESSDVKAKINQLKSAFQETGECLTRKRLKLSNEAESNSENSKAKMNCDFETEQNVVGTAKQSNKEIDAEILCCDELSNDIEIINETVNLNQGRHHRRSYKKYFDSSESECDPISDEDVTVVAKVSAINTTPIRKHIIKTKGKKFTFDIKKRKSIPKRKSILKRQSVNKCMNSEIQTNFSSERNEIDEPCVNIAENMLCDNETRMKGRVVSFAPAIDKSNDNAYSNSHSDSQKFLRVSIKKLNCKRKSKKNVGASDTLVEDYHISSSSATSNMIVNKPSGNINIFGVSHKNSLLLDAKENSASDLIKSDKNTSEKHNLVNKLHDDTKSIDNVQNKTNESDFDKNIPKNLPDGMVIDDNIALTSGMNCNEQKSNNKHTADVSVPDRSKKNHKNSLIIVAKENPDLDLMQRDQNSNEIHCLEKELCETAKSIDNVQIKTKDNETNNKNLLKNVTENLADVADDKTASTSVASGLLQNEKKNGHKHMVNDSEASKSAKKKPKKFPKKKDSKTKPSDDVNIDDIAAVFKKSQKNNLTQKEEEIVCFNGENDRAFSKINENNNDDFSEDMKVDVRKNKKTNKTSRKQKLPYKKTGKNTFLVHAEVHPPPPPSLNISEIENPNKENDEHLKLQHLQVSVVLSDFLKSKNVNVLNVSPEKNSIPHKSHHTKTPLAENLLNISPVLKKNPSPVLEKNITSAHENALSVDCKFENVRYHRRNKEVKSYKEPSLTKKMRR